MKAYKFEVICFDPNGDCDLMGIEQGLQNQKYFCTQIRSVQFTEIGEWRDDHPLNKFSESETFIQNAEWESLLW